MGILLTLTATSCTKTDLAEENEEIVKPLATEGDDEEVKSPPKDD
ncbi:hypothetical protein [Flavivirga eckloniae]|nr:hypothetical protein [Flavivirga eckloniae]